MLFPAKPFNLAALMLERTPVDAVRHPDIKRSRAAAHDVNEILVIRHIGRRIIILSED
jgi:hypothetical protein